MAKILAKARQSPVLAVYRPDDLEYMKYENTNLAKKRATERPASETRISSKMGSLERRAKTPTYVSRNVEEKMPVKTGANSSQGEAQPKRSKTLISSSKNNNLAPASSIADIGRGSNPVLVKRPGSSSSRRSEESSKKLVQFRKCKTDIKILPDKQRPQTVQGLSRKSVSKEKPQSPTSKNPLKEVRRKLKFDNIDNGDIDELNAENELGHLDFTDKIIAIKNVIGKSRDTRDILDRKAYYNEYKSSQKRIMVSRSDSLKENNLVRGETFVVSEDLKRPERDSDKEQGESNMSPSISDRGDRSRESRARSVKSADIFEPRNNEGRLSVDLNKLRANLEEKRQKAKDLNKDMITDRQKSQPKIEYATDRNSTPKKGEVSDDDLIHAKSGRKVLRSSEKVRQDPHAGHVTDIHLEERRVTSNLRPSSRQEMKSRQDDRPSSRSSARLESRETQTNLNHSIHSVQSNVPFYETKRPVQDNFSNEKVHRRTPCRIQENLISELGFENEIDHISPEKHNFHEEKQTNVGDYLKAREGTEEALKYSHKQVDKDLEHLRSKLSWLMDRDTAKQSNSNSQVIYAKGDVIQGNSNHNRQKSKVKSNTLADLLLSEEKLERGNEENVDQKVRDWIKTQQVLSGNYHSNNQRNIQAVVIEELSVSVSIRNEANTVRDTKVVTNNIRETEAATYDSNDTCDKIPVKLEKVDFKDSRPGTALSNKARQLRLTGATVTSEVLHTRDDLKDLQGNIDEVPTRDVQMRGPASPEALPDIDSSETESSILSLPFSVRSGESVSSTIQAVKLLRKLYHVEPDRRQNLVLMARCFRRWLNNVLYAKARNLQITQAAHRVSPVTYGVMIRKGEICYRTGLLTRYFTRWKEQLEDVKLNNAVADLQRKHLLKKGMNAFKWAINRSKLRQGILQDRVSGILLASNFRKWKYRAIENRRLRMQQAFLRWRQYTKEAQKIRTLRNQTNTNLKVKLFKHWCERYSMRVKQHRADANYRSKLLSQSMMSWKLFVVLTKEKKHRKLLAIQLYERTVQRKMFVQMQMEYTKYTQAKEKHRVCQLKVAILAWKTGAELSKEERLNNMRVAEVCWVRTTIRTTFTTWRDALLTRRAIRLADAVLTKKSFKMWHDRYKFLVKRRADVDLYVRTKTLTQSFQQWSVFVNRMRQRRERAIECIHNVLQRRVIQTWIWYTHNQRDLRRRLRLFIRKTEIETQKKYLDVWRTRFKVKCDEQRAQQFWSNMCAKKAADHWKMICHRRKLVRLLRETEPERQLTLQKVFFLKWLSRLQQIENEKQEAADVRLVLDQSLMKKCFDKWKVASQKLLLIKPMVLQHRQTLLIELKVKKRGDNIKPFQNIEPMMAQGIVHLTKRQQNKTLDCFKRDVKWAIKEIEAKGEEVNIHESDSEREAKGEEINIHESESKRKAKGEEINMHESESEIEAKGEEITIHESDTEREAKGEEININIHESESKREAKGEEINMHESESEMKAKGEEINIHESETEREAKGEEININIHERESKREAKGEEINMHESESEIEAKGEEINIHESETEREAKGEEININESESKREAKGEEINMHESESEMKAKGEEINIHESETEREAKGEEININIHERESKREAKGEEINMHESESEIEAKGEEINIHESETEREAKGEEININESESKREAKGEEINMHESESEIEAKGEEINIHESESEREAKGEEINIHESESEREAKGEEINIHESDCKREAKGEEINIHESESEREAKGEEINIYESESEIEAKGEEININESDSEREAKEEEINIHASDSEREAKGEEINIHESESEIEAKGEEINIHESDSVREAKGEEINIHESDSEREAKGEEINIYESESEIEDDSYIDETYQPSDDTSESDHFLENLSVDRVEESFSEGESSDVYPALSSKAVKLNCFSQNIQEESETNQSDEEELNEDEILRDIKNPGLYIKKVLKSAVTKSGKFKKNDRVFNSYQYCGACKVKTSNLAQHLSRHDHDNHPHKDNPEIQLIKKEKNKALKKKLLKSLRGKFNHECNMKTIEKGKGEILLERRPVSDIWNLSDYGPCPYCLFWVAKKLLKKHVKVCINGKNDIHTSIGDLTTQSECIAKQVKSSASKTLVKEVFGKMVADEIASVAKSDTLIIQLGNQWMERVRGNTLKRGSYTSQIMRLAGRLLLNLRKIKPLSGIPEPWIWDYLKPEHFSSIVDAAILTSVPVQDDDESLESPSNAIKLGYDIKRLINGKIGLSIINNNPTSREDAENLIKLMNIYWGTKVTKHARVILEERKYYAVKNLPLPEDIQKLSNHLRDSILSLDLSKTDSANFREVGRLIETKLVTYNRRRTGEVQAIRLADYARRIKGQAGAHLVGDLSKFEKHLLESQEVMTVRGKTGRPVPIILPQDTVQGLQYLTDPDIRKSAGVNSSNQYVFASKGDSVIWAYEALKKTAEAAMLRNPGAITSTNLRKYMATITQVLDLKEHQMQWVLNHMGHTLDVHKLHYSCFQKWRQYVVQKAQCSHANQEVVKLRLKNKFSAWRRQFKVHQIEKDYNKKLVERQAVRCLQAWKFVIQCKHAGRRFYENHLVKSSFYYWNMLAVQQVRQKKLKHMEQEMKMISVDITEDSIMNTLREYFDRWRTKMQKQQTQSEQGLEHIQQLQQTNSLRYMFMFWRRHFRATLISRENEKIRTRRLAKQALQEWHQYTQNSLQEAVQRFAAAIGLHVEGVGDSLLEHIDVIEKSNLSENEMLFEGHIEPLNLDQDVTPDSIQSPRTPRTPKTPKTPHTPRTPRQRSGYATPLKRLFSQSPSRLTQSQDFDATPLLSSSFLDARFEMEQAVKTESRREIVVTAITRLRHWPLSNIFDQWKDFTARQLEFKHLTTQIKSVKERLDLQMYFKDWIAQYRNTQTAKQHYNQVIQHKALLSLILYRNSRKQKNHLKHLANQHYARHVYTAMFPLWLQKTQEKQHTEHILHLWSNITSEEQQLIPRERSFKYKLNRKLLTSCFKAWQTEFRKIDKLKKTHHRILLERYFGAWCSWALEKHRQRASCEEFRSRRIKALVYKQWCLRYKQKTEVARRYQDTWYNYKGRIFQAWHTWARDQRKYKLLAQQIMMTRNSHLVTQMFVTWKTSTERQIQIQKYFEVKLSRRSLYAWHEVAVWQKDLRNRMLECRLMSYKILAKQTFTHWHSSYCRRIETKKLHDQIVEKRVLRIARKWRRKAQSTRGQWLKQKLEQRLVQRNLEKWKTAYRKCQDREAILDKYISKKHGVLLSKCLSTWRIELMALQAGRVFDMRLMAAFIENWKIAAKGCKQRRLVLQAHQAKKQIQVQKGYFLYWFNVAMARKSIRGHANLKIQLSVFKAWLLYTRKQINLRRLEKTFTRKRNEKIQQKYWYIMKTRFHYCVELTEMSKRMVTEKNNRLMKMTLTHWHFKLKMVIADEYYEHLLARRTARQWVGYVAHRKQERQHMEELMKKAAHFYNKKLCVRMYTAWHNEVLATRHNNKRKVRLSEKYARIWKHRVDLAYTATCMYEEKLYLLVWKTWHLEFVKRKAEQKVVAFDKKQKLSMIFISWRNLCRKKSRKFSMIPVPVSPAFNMPTAPRSSNSTPTDEVFTPPPVTAKPTQIPLPSSSGTRNKSVSMTNGRNTPTNINGRSTPTNIARRTSNAL